MSDKWYFAYGSNLASDQKVSRTGPIRQAKRARLEGYSIAFNKRGADGTGKANIVPNHNDTVWGAVYRCSPSALEKMDRHEGVSRGHYARKWVRVWVDGDNELTAVTYIAGDAFIDNSLTPSQEYLHKIIRGARDHRLPDDYVRRVHALGNGSDRGGPERAA